MANLNKQIGTIFLQIALSFIFIIGGIYTLIDGNGDELSAAIFYIFKGDFARIISIIFAIFEIIAGVFLFLRLFLNINTVFDSVLMIILMICWIVAIICVDFIGIKGIFQGSTKNAILPFLNRFARHLLVLGAIIRVKTR